jgi:hypothetical protein
VLAQSLVLGSIQTVISVSVNGIIALTAGSIASFPRHQAELAIGAALPDGHGTRGACGENRVRSQAGVRRFFTSPRLRGEVEIRNANFG